MSLADPIMILNAQTPDPSQLKVMILSCPKTGNTWLRWLLHYAYALPMVDLPQEWSDDYARNLPWAFVTHQHLWPSEEFVQWLAKNKVVVLTTIRHPADTLLSYFHFAKWQDLSADPGAAAMAKDGERPGMHALNFAKHSFAQAYSISLAWARLGAHVVRYEDLLEDPVEQLRVVTSRIAPIDDYKVRAAAFLCKPEQLIRPGLVDPRHLRTATSRRWVRELPAEIVEMMSRMQPYRSACETYGYDWDASSSDPPRYDYTPIDPFRGLAFFDNGEPIGPSLARVYLHEAVDSSLRWQDPTKTEGDSFWNWLRSPCEKVAVGADLPPGTLTNLMMALYQTRPDLQLAFPNPQGSNRSGFVAWFLGQAATEFEIPWGLVCPVLDSYCEHLNAMEGERAVRTRGRISGIVVRNGSRKESDAFSCGDDILIEMLLTLESSVEDAVVGFSLRGADGRVVFGTNTILLGSPLPVLGAGNHVCRIRSKLTIPPQSCYVSVGLARYDGAGGVEAIHRIYDHLRITVTGVASSGANWCETTIALESRPEAD